VPCNATAITITAISIAGFSITLAVAMTKSLAVSVASTQALWGPVGIGDASGVPGNATAQANSVARLSITLAVAMVKSISVASSQALWGPVRVGDASGVPGNATAQAIPGLSICITLSSAPIASAFKSVCLDRWPALLVIAITDACLSIGCSKESRKSQEKFHYCQCLFNPLQKTELL